ncbi:hypothetical protein DFQ26_003381 [Actinomortierella ambigua]|nr:hypothetical protein DFQ26_003381 [Actinomortierella ambigua]
MKFAKCLQEEIVPEWRKAYINYKQGKKLLKAIEKALDDEAQELVKGIEGSNLESVPTPISTYGRRRRLRSERQGSTASTKQSAPMEEVHSPPTSPTLTFSPDPTTPIVQRPLGQSRNYSSITNILSVAEGKQPAQQAQPEGSLSSPLLPSPSQDGSTAPEESSAQGTTVQGSVDFVPQERPRLFKSGSQFGQAALTQGSQMLRSLSRRFTIVQPNLYALKPRDVTLQEGQTIHDIYDQLLPEERVFFDFLDGQLKMVNDFYREKEEDAVTKLKVIKQQIFVADEWKRRHDQKVAKAEAEQGWYQNEWSKVRSGIDSLMRIDTSTTENIIIRSSFQAPAGAAAATAATTGAIPVGDFGKRGLNQRNFRQYDSEGGRVHGGPHATDLEQEAMQAHLVELERENRRQHLNHKVARTRIKAALYEYYRSLEMLKNYKVLNHTGFAKILKKFDKTAGWRASKTYVNTKLQSSYLVTSSILADLIAETEEVFIDTFEKGHRRRGMAKLRIPDSKNQTHHVVTTRIGFYIGLAAPLMVQAVQSAFSEETEREIPIWHSLLLVYGGLFITILFACLFGINMYVWSKARINYKFIFEFDPRDNLDFHEYFELPVFFMLLLTLAVYLDFGTKYTQHVATAYWPLIFMSITLFILFCPLPVFHFTSRRWFIASIGRILASGYYRVEFRDFFLADEMNSLSYSIEQFEFAMCAYVNEWEDLGLQCQTSRMWITPFLTALPPWFRFLQCLRRYRDTFEWFPHLINAGKYSASLINQFVYFSYRHYGGMQLKSMWIFCSFVTSIYTFGWDVYMDWGLFRFGKYGGGAVGRPFLRAELVYPHRWVYYAAIVFDFVGRFSWLSRLLLPGVTVHLLSFSLAMLEMLRRWVWNFFRLENEHINNVGQFRAIKDIPLPFHIRVHGDSDDEDEEDDEREQLQNREGAAAAAKSAGTRPASALDGGRPPHPERWGSGFSGTSGAQRSSTMPVPGVPSRASSSNLSQSLGSEGDNGGGVDQQGLFEVSRTSDFVDTAVAETGFHETPSPASVAAELEEANASIIRRGRFYNRRDFDSRFLDGDDDGILGSRVTRSMSLNAAFPSSLSSGHMPGLLQTVLGVNQGGGEEGGLAAPQPRRQYSAGGIGARMRNTIFGRRTSSDDDYDTEEEEVV